MSDYTPTTEEVRFKYARISPRNGAQLVERQKEFDRWLAAHDAEKRAEWEVEQGQRFLCDGRCNYNDGPDESCSRHGRSPADLWRVIGELIQERDEALAAAGVAPQPEPEYEYGNRVTFHSGTQIMPASDRETAMKMAWLQPAFRRVKAGAWEPTPNQSDGGS